LLPIFLVAPEPRLRATVEGGKRCRQPGSGPHRLLRTFPHTIQRALRAVPIHENSELYHMLRSMSKQTFTARMFTYITRDIHNINRAQGPEPFPQLLCFHHLSKIPLKAAELKRFPLCSSRSSFSAGAGSNLNPLEPLRAGRSSAPHRRPKPACKQLGQMVLCTITSSTQYTRRSTMKESDHSIHFHSPAHSGIDFEGKEDSGNTGRLTQAERLNFSTGPAAKPQNVSFLTTRCSEKGCVFPAASTGHEKCVYHMHQQEEPVLFRSHQPSGMLLDPARTMPTEKEYDGSRKRDRRRMSAIWERFQNDGTS
jgi:hypothetical protein